MLRYLLPACLLLAAAPAWATDYCKTTVARPGGDAIVEGFVDGSVLTSVRIEDILIPGKVTMDPEAKGYTASGDGMAGLTPYRVGHSLEGKGWQTPGSVSTTFGAMAIHWPRFYKDGKQIKETLIYFGVNGSRQGIASTNVSSTPDAQTIFVDWDRAWWYQDKPHGYRGQGLYSDAERNFWSSAATPGGQLRVDFYDGGLSRLIGSATFSWPEDAAWNKRMAEQVNALRAMSAAEKCTLAVKMDLGADNDDEDEEF